MDQILYIAIAALMTILCVLQALLAIHQIKKNAPDGRILLRISIIVFLLWVPLCVFKFMFPKILPLQIVWFVFAGAYMIFGLWYTNSLSKQKQKGQS